MAGKNPGTDSHWFDDIFRKTGGIDGLFWRKRTFVEELEVRRMLSGTHDAALVSAITAALQTNSANGLSQFASRLTDTSSLGRNLPLVGTKLGQQYNPKNTLNQTLNRLAASYPTLTALQTALEGAAGVADGLQVTGIQDLPDDLELNLHFNTTTNQSISLAGDYGLPFDLGGSINVAANLDLQTTIGAYWDSVANAPVVYVQSPNTHFVINTSVSTANLSATAHLGFVDINITNGSASFTPSFDVTMVDPGSEGGQPGRTTLNELQTTPVGTLIQTNVTSASPTSVSFTVSTPQVPGSYNLNFNWASIANPNLPSSNLGTDPLLSTLNAFVSLDPSKISFGVDHLTDLLQDAATTSPLFQTNLPLINKNLATIIGLPTFVHNTLSQYTDTTTDSGGVTHRSFNTADQLKNLLQNISGVGVGNITETSTASDIRFHLHQTGSINQNYSTAISLAPSLNLSFNGSINVHLNTTLDLTFGLNTADGTFFIVDTGTPTLQLSGGVTLNLNTSANFGFLGITITNGTATMNASAALQLHDPQTDSPATPGLITTNELSAGNLSSLISTSFSGSASLSLPMSTTLFPETGTLSAAWSDITNPSTFTVDTSQVTKFFNFNAITPQTVLQGLQAIPAMLNKLSDSTSLGKDLQFIGSSLSSLLSLGTQFSNYISSLSSGTFSVQQLQQTLNSQIGSSNVVMTINGTDIQFALKFTQNLVNQTVKYNINKTVAGFGLQASGNLTVNGAINAGIRFGVGFAPGLTTNQRFYIVPGADSSIAGTFKVAATGISFGASLGFLNLGITGGTADVAGITSGAIDTTKPASLGLSLIDPNNNDNKITLDELTGNPLAALGPLTVSGAVKVHLPITTGLPSPGGPSPSIDLNWTNITDPSSLTVTPNNLGDLSSASAFAGAALQAGINAIVNLILSWKNLSILNTNIPLINKPISSIFDFATKAASFFQHISNFNSGAAFDSAVQAAITASGLDPSQVSLAAQPDNNPSTGVFHYKLNFHYDFLDNAGEAFNWGSSLFTMNVSLKPDIKFNANLEFGFSPGVGFYLVDQGGSTPEVNVQASLNANFNKVGGSFGPINYGVANGTGIIALTAGLDLKDPANSGKITTAEIASDPGSVLSPTFTGNASVHLPLGATLGDAGPGITTVFDAGWDLNNGFTFGAGHTTNPADGFGPVNFEMGEWLHNILGPVLDNIAKYNPLPQKIIDILNYKLPLIDETPAEILATDVLDEPAVAILIKIESVISTLSSIAAGNTIDLSPYFTTPPGNSPALTTGPGSTRQATPGDTGSPGGGLIPAGATQFLSDLKNNYYISLPVFDNPASSIISLLLGQDVKLIEFHPPKLELKASLDLPQITIPIFSIGIADASVFAQIGGYVGFFANVDLGLDTTGLTGHNINHEKNLIDGFFLGNSDDFQVGFEGGVYLNVGGQIDVFGFPLVQVYGQLGLDLTLGLHVSDVRYQPGNNNVPVAFPNGRVGRGDSGGDGIVHLDELDYLFSQYGILCTLTPGGNLSLHGGIGFRGPDIWPFGNIPDIYKDIGTIKIIDFDVPCNPPPPITLADYVGNALVMRPDSTTGTHRHLDIHIVDDKNLNPSILEISRSDDSGIAFQDFPIADLLSHGTNTLIIEGSPGGDIIKIDPLVTTVLNIQYITVNSHDGDDQVSFGTIDQTKSHLLGTTINAGNGKDTLTGTFGPDLITGGLGNDLVTTGQGNDTVNLGDGNDTVSTGDGHEQVTTGNGNSLVTVGNGGSMITVGNGQNTIGAGTGDDIIFAGNGGNKVHDLSGNNTVTTGSGQDQIVLDGTGNNSVSAGGGDDTVSTNSGNDTIFGGTGNDLINAFDGNNIIYGNDGNDTVNAGSGNDYVDGGNGNNRIYPGNGDNKVIAADGNNLVVSGSGQDIVLAGNGNDTFTLGGGDDFVSVGSGANAIDGGAGNDVVAATGDVNFTLKNNGITTPAGAGSLTNVERVSLTGGPGANIFDVSGWTGSTVELNGGGNAGDVVYSADDTNFTLTNTTLTRSDGASFHLNGITLAHLIGGTHDNIFDVSLFIGQATLEGGGGNDRVVSTNNANANYTLTDTLLTRSTSGSFVLNGINRAQITGGPGATTINASGFSGNTTLIGGAGNDSLVGGSGDDCIVGGTGTDSLIGNSGVDLLDGTGGTGDFFDGGAGDDHLIGSSTADSMVGGAGNDVIEGNAGNDSIDGGAGNDSLYGGDGNDLLIGGLGTDVILGQAGNDALYAYGLTSAGDDKAVNYLYGDFGTNGNEAGSGNDTLYTGGGADIAFGEGGSNTTTPILITVGTGGSGATLTLPTGPDSQGPWAEFGSSASGGGVSGSPSSAIEPAIAASSNGQFIAWADDRTGNYEIYVAEHTAGGWIELAGSAHGGGISNTAGASRRPSITVDASGNPIVSWTEFGFGPTDIRAAKYDPTANGGLGAWVAMGTSLTAGGISAINTADNSRVMVVNGNPVIAWLDHSGGAYNVYVKQFSGGVWSAIAAGSASGNGVTGSGSNISEFSAATDGTKIALAWTTPASQIDLLQFNGGVWAPVNNSTTGGGVSNSAGSASQPTVAYHAGSIFVAWQDTIGGVSNIAAATNNGGVWQIKSIDIPASAGNAITRGQSARPVLAENGGTLTLVWAEDRLPGLSAQDTELFANRYVGGSFKQLLNGQAAFNGIYLTSSAITNVALASDPTGRPYVAWTDTSSGSPQIYARGDTFAVHNVYYVNDGLTPDDTITTAAGSAANSGTSPDKPLNSIAAVLANYVLVAGDVILMDAGNYSGFTVTSADSGFLILGAGGVPSTITGPVNLNGSHNIVLDGLNLTGGLALSGEASDEIVDNTGGAVTISGGSNTRLEHNVFGSLALSGGTANATVVYNGITGNVSIGSGGASNLLLTGNFIYGGLSLANAASGTITVNDISNIGATGLDLQAAFTGSIDHNSIHGSSVGVNYATGELLNANRIYANTTGVNESVNNVTSGLGFVSGSIGNDIFGNTTGVNLTGRMQLQHVYGNTTGVAGSGILGGTSLDTANLIEFNTTGVNFTGTVQFTRISRNTTGVIAHTGEIFTHNLVYRNQSAGFQTGGASDVRIVNNTFYSTTGNEVQVDGGSTNVQVLNNIMWAAGGFDLSVANDSRSGFFSDYNDLYSTGTGKIVHYVVDFTDILDWQDNLNYFDLHSIGTTAVNPLWAQPRFYNLGTDDFRVNALIGGQRFSSPTVDAGDPMIDIGLPPNRTNQLTDAGFETGITGWTVNTHGTTSSAAPTSFDGTAHFVSGGDPAGFVTQTVDLSTIQNLDLSSIQNNVVVFGGRSRWATNQPGDNAFVRVTFLDTGGNPIGTATVNSTNTTDRWELFGSRTAIPAGTKKITFRYEADRTSGPTNDNSFDGAFLYVQPNTFAPDQGAFGGTVSEDTQNTQTHIALRWPDLYTDWDVNKPHNIQWETYNNLSIGGNPANTVRIDLFQDTATGPVFLKNIALSVADNGSYTWIPSSSGMTAGTFGLRIQISLVGADPNAPAIAFDRSAETFAIPQAGNNYYVNDSSTIGDTYTTAVGNNRNTGKLPGAPKPLLTNLLRTYDLGAANTVFVDTGDYHDFTPIVLDGAHDSGVTITGPTDPTKIASLSRDYLTAPGAVIEVTNGASALVFQHFTLFGSQRGILVHNGSIRFQGSYLTTSNNSQEGFRFESDAETSSLDHATVSNSGFDGIYTAAKADSITNSTVTNSTRWGIDVTGANALIDSNTVVGNGSGGIIATASNSAPAFFLTVSNNSVHNNLGDGIQAYYANITGNSSFNQAGFNGIYMPAIAFASNNTAYGNARGMYVSGGSTASGNRVYANTDAGIAMYNGTVSGNKIYSNAVGIRGGDGFSGNTGTIANNLIYANTGFGIWLRHSSTLAVNNNTVYQTASDAIHLQDSSASVTLRNNILWATAGYDIFVTPDSQSGFGSDYNDLYVTGGGKVASWQGTDYLLRDDWFRGVGFDPHSFGADPLFNNIAGADGILGYVGGVDHGIDDDFSLKSNSPGIDAGDLLSYYLTEPSSGGRVNLGSAGNTLQATPSNAQTVQVLTPNGLEQLSTGTATTINWRAFGLGQNNTIALINTGGPTVDNWLADAYQTFSYSTNTNNVAIDLTGVTNPAPLQLYQTYDYAQGGVGSELAYSLPVPNGTYNIRLHFEEPQVSAAGQRTFDVKVNGQVVQANYDIYAVAGNLRNKAVALTLNGLTATGGAGFNIELVTKDTNGWPAIISGIELSQPAGGVANPKVDLAVSLDGGATYSNIATGLTMDAYGRGSYQWTPATGSSNALIRVTSEDVPAVQDASDRAFTIGSGHSYYVNDNSTLNDEYSTAVGNDSNSGRDPAHPKLTFTSLFNDFPNLGAGDTVFVDNGTYVLSGNLLITSAHNGLTIKGPVVGTHQALINRSNTTSGSYGIELKDVVNLTLDHLSVTGGYYGIYSDQLVSTAGSDHLTVGNSTVFSNFSAGIYLQSYSDFATITNNQLFSNGNYGIDVEAPDDLVSGNTVHNHNATGIYAHGLRTRVLNNTSYSNSTGIDITASSTDPTTWATASGNIVHDNSSTGILASYSNATSNTAYNQTAGSGLGFNFNGPGAGSGNVAYTNVVGFQVNSTFNATNNRAYNNSDAGFTLYSSAVVSGNISYSNHYGIRVGDSFSGSSGTIANNLIYANTTGGIITHNASGLTIANNTIYQTAGDAVHLQDSSQNVNIRNNILWDTAGYDIFVANNSQNGFASDYNDVYVTGTGNVGNWQGVVYATRVDWFRTLGFDVHSLSADPQFNNPAGPDAVLGYSAGVDHGVDDDFSLKSTSPNIDSGDPLSFYLGEPQPNGGRVNVGADGNTLSAAPSGVREVQILSPNGYEQLSTGTPVAINWRAFGLGQFNTVALINAGSATAADNWAANAFQSVAYSTSTNNVAIDTSLVVNPAPQQVYQTFAYASGGQGTEIAYQLPVPDGAYTLRLHFEEPQVSSVGQRTFDVKVNGQVLQSGYDIYAAAGNARNKAVTLTLNANAVAGSGLNIELVTKDTNGWPAIVFGIELLQSNPGVANPAVDLQYSLDGGGTWNNIATGLTMDAYGRGSYQWTPSSASDTALVRVQSDDYPSFSDQSDNLFSIGAGHSYYVNDNSTAGDEYATAIGSNANSGRDPAHPMASLAALLQAYPNIGAGDTVYVDTGSYTLATNVLIGSSHNGLTIQGPLNAAHQAILNRANTTNGAYGIELKDVVNLTLDHLSVTGGYYGIYSDQLVSTAGSDHLTVSNSTIFSNFSAGIYLQSYSDFATITNNQLFSNGNYGIDVEAPDDLVSGNTVHNHNATGIYAHGLRTRVLNNTSYSNSTGIDITASSTDPTTWATASGNIVHDNSSYGFNASYSNLTGNTAYSQTNTGFYLSTSVVASGNTAYANAIGFQVVGSSIATGNRAYNNTDTGFALYNTGTVQGNRSYSNAIGVRVGDTFSGSNGTIINNVIYANTTGGIITHNANFLSITNNTIYQTAGDAVHLQDNSQNVNIRNNILWDTAGYDMFVATNSEAGFASDYNDFYTTGAGKIANWQTVDYASRVNWYLSLGFDGHGFTADPLLVNIAGADGVLGYSGGVDHGIDDVFTLTATSPAIDAGDPTSLFLTEPQPNGGRINVGSDGNTTQATASASPVLQILGPNGNEELTVGTPATISWNGTGLTKSTLMGLINAGGPAVGNFAANIYQIVSYSTTTNNVAIDTSLVSNPAPQQVYQTYAYAQGNQGTEIAYVLPVPDGSYTLRLDFAEPSVNAPNQRFFDVKVNGAVVQTNYDIYAAAGGRNKAVALVLPGLVAGGGAGLKIELVTKDTVGWQAMLCGIELGRDNPSGNTSPTVDLQVSVDNGAHWGTIASNVPTDSFGNGSYLWTPTLASGQALIRVISDNVGGLLDVSDAPFTIGTGHSYYVNDSSTVGDEYSTAAGSLTNNGRDPGHPMASLLELLNLYPNIGAGDTVYVDTGSYSSPVTLVLGPSHNGLTIKGPVKTGDTATINRGTSANSAYVVFDLQNILNFTLDHLVITGGYEGIRTDSIAGLGSDHLTISNCSVNTNSNLGIDLDFYTDHVTITGNTLFGDGYGLYLNGSGDNLVSSNTAFNNTQYGFYVAGPRTVITNNVAFGNATGMNLTANSSTPTDYLTVTGNIAHDNTRDGIDATYSNLTNNTAYNQASGSGFTAGFNTYISNNLAYNNLIGITSNSTDTVSGNRIYNNSQAGIMLTSNGTITGNHIYSNGIGIQAGSTFSSATGALVASNLIYSNVTQGVLILNTTSGFQLLNNTIYQPGGDAVRIQNSSQAIVLRNNILQASAGYDIYVDPNSQTGFNSNYNDLITTANANSHVGFWGNAIRNALSDWQIANSQDANSIVADPKWVDIDGADNLLGYNVNTATDGGADDNFFLSHNSPAIDAGDSWIASTTDYEGYRHVDDPATNNTGSLDFAESNLGSSSFNPTSGTAKGWTYPAQTALNFTLPFTFNFYGTPYTTLYVGSSGALGLGANGYPPINTVGAVNLSTFQQYPMIAALWSPTLATNITGDNIFVDTSIANQVTFRWLGSNTANGNSPANFAITLFSTGKIRFDYGAGNAFASPIVGISGGPAHPYLLSAYNGQASLANANSVEFNTTVNGVVDMGAYEFRASSSDATAPTIVSSTPAGVATSGSTGPVTSIQLNFSEPINDIDANAIAEYDLRSAGADGIFDNNDDLRFTVAPVYSGVGTVVSLNITGAFNSANVALPYSGLLPGGQYRLKVFSNVTGTSIHDLAGLKLDGDANGTEGGDYVRLFTVYSNITGRQIFYNNSGFDGNNTAANAADDSAIDTTKQALLPTQKATFANYTSYTKGINGVMIDVAGLPLGVTLTATDFNFTVGADMNVAGWSTLAPAPTITVRNGAGPGHADRIELTWADGLILNEWLKVTLLADKNTGLQTQDIFYFGNTVGESGNSATDTAVTTADELGARGRLSLTAVGVTSQWDYDRSGFIDTADVLAARGHQTSGSSTLPLITAPAAPVSITVTPPPTAPSVTTTTTSSSGNTAAITASPSSTTPPATSTTSTSSGKTPSSPITVSPTVTVPTPSTKAATLPITNPAAPSPLLRPAITGTLTQRPTTPTTSTSNKSSSQSPMKSAMPAPVKSAPALSSIFNNTQRIAPPKRKSSPVEISRPVTAASAKPVAKLTTSVKK